MSEQEQEIGDRLRQWRREHPHATFDEIDAEVARQYDLVQAAVVAELSAAAPAGSVDAVSEAVCCPQCQTTMQRRGRRTRRIPTRRGVPVALTRDYYVCPACGTGLFPPG